MARSHLLAGVLCGGVGQPVAMGERRDLAIGMIAGIAFKRGIAHSQDLARTAMAIRIILHFEANRRTLGEEIAIGIIGIGHAERIAISGKALYKKLIVLLISPNALVSSENDHNCHDI